MRAVHDSGLGKVHWVPVRFLVPPEYLLFWRERCRISFNGATDLKFRAARYVRPPRGFREPGKLHEPHLLGHRGAGSRPPLIANPRSRRGGRLLPRQTEGSASVHRTSICMEQISAIRLTARHLFRRVPPIGVL